MNQPERLVFCLGSVELNLSLIDFKEKYFPRVSMRNVWDVLFVLILPALCFIYDPILFHAFDSKPLFAEPMQIASYIAVTSLAAAFFVSFLELKNNTLKILMCGTMFAGTAVAFAFGILLLPFSLLGLVVGVGLLGFIPFFTTKRFWKRFKELQPIEIRKPSIILLVAFGFAIPFIPSIGAHNYATGVRTKMLNDLTGEDEAQIRKAMSQLNGTILCTYSCTVEVIDNFQAGKIKLPESEFTSLLKKYTDINYKQFLDDRAND